MNYADKGVQYHEMQGGKVLASTYCRDGHSVAALGDSREKALESIVKAFASLLSTREMFAKAEEK